MKRTTISLPDEVAAALEREARRRRVPVSQVAREAIESKLGLDAPRDLPFIGMVQGEGGPSDIAGHFDDWLAGQRILDLETDADPGGR